MSSVINIEVGDTGWQSVYIPLNIPDIGTHTFTLNVTLSQENFNKRPQPEEFRKNACVA